MTTRAGRIALDTKLKTVGPNAGITQDIIEIAGEIHKISVDLAVVEDSPPGEGGGPILVAGSLFLPTAAVSGGSVGYANDMTPGAVPFGGMSEPRTLLVKMTVFGDAPLTGTLTIDGISNQGEVIQDVFVLADLHAAFLGGGSQGIGTSNAYAVVTAMVLSANTWPPDQYDDSDPPELIYNGGTTGQANDYIEINTGGTFGLPVPPGATDIEVLWSNQDAGTPGTVDQTYGTITPTSAPDDSRSFLFYYRYTAPAAA